MTPERWQMVRGILESAMELRPEERGSYLDRECASDPTLRKDVDEYLSIGGRLDPGFLESPAAKHVELSSLSGDSTLAKGTRLGNYEVHALLGAGGMGQVYRARDLLLKRDVAIKIIPGSLSSDPSRLHRFRQEAEATAALSHPNILTVYQVGEQSGTYYIVAELLQGSTLRERLRAGAVPVRTAIDYGVQIARGLAAAHDRGIIHCDLKPENVFVTRDGHIKILDFGLAKLIEQRHESKTIARDDKSTATQFTEPGMALGTAAYMSPEQVRGDRVDHHSDIFAFGSVLYEMLTGRMAFAKGTSAEIMTAILKEDPPALSQGGQNIPPGMQKIIQRCLEKQPERRFQSASDLAFALEALSDSGSVAAVDASRKSSARWMWRSAAVGALVIAISVAVWYLTHPLPPPRITAYTQITHDGRDKRMGGTDGTRIYFTQWSPNAMWVVPLLGGAATRLGDGEYESFTPDGASVIYSTPKGDIFIIRTDGTESHKLASIGSTAGGVRWSPDGKSIRFDKDNKLWEMSSDGSGLHRLLPNWHERESQCCGFWTPDGRFYLFLLQDRLGSEIWALEEKHRPFWRRSSEPVRLTTGPLAWGGPVPSRDGKKIFARAVTLRGELSRITPKSGVPEPFLGGISAEFVSCGLCLFS